MAPEVNVRRLTSQEFFGLEKMRKEENKELKEIIKRELKKLPLLEGPGEESLRTVFKVTNDRSSTAWNELFNAQRTEEDKYCDVHMIADDGHIRVHGPFLMRLSTFLETVINEGNVSCKDDVVSITLAGVKVDHLRVVLSMLYGGIGIISDDDQQYIDNILDMLQIKSLEYGKTKCHPRKKGRKLRCYKNDDSVPSSGHPSSQASTESASAPSNPIPVAPNCPTAEQPQGGSLATELPEVVQKLTSGSGYVRNPDKRIIRRHRNFNGKNTKPNRQRPPTAAEGQTSDNRGDKSTILPDEVVKIAPNAHIKLHQEPRIKRHIPPSSADRSSLTSEGSRNEMENPENRSDSPAPPRVSRYEHDDEYVPSPGVEVDAEEEEIVELILSDDENGITRPTTRNGVRSRNRSTSDDRRYPKRKKRCNSSSVDAGRNKSVDELAGTEEELADGSRPPSGPRTRQRKLRGRTKSGTTDSERSTGKDNGIGVEPLVKQHQCIFCDFCTPDIHELEVHLDNECAKHLKGIYILRQKYCKICNYFFSEMDCSELMDHISVCACNIKPKTARKRAKKQALSSPSTSKNDGVVAANSSKNSITPTTEQEEGAVSPRAEAGPATKKVDFSPGVLQIKHASIILDRLTDEVIYKLVDQIRQGKVPEISRHKLQRRQAYAKLNEKSVIAQPIKLNESSVLPTVAVSPDVILQVPPLPVNETHTAENPRTLNMKKCKKGGKKKRKRWGVGRKKLGQTQTPQSPSKQKINMKMMELHIKNITEKEQTESDVPNETSTIEPTTLEPVSSVTRNDIAADRAEGNEIVQLVNAAPIENETLQPDSVASEEISDIGTLTIDSVRPPLDAKMQQTALSLRRKLQEKLNPTLSKIRRDDDEPTLGKSNSTSSINTTATSSTPPNAETSNSTSNIAQNDSTEQSGQILGQINNRVALEHVHHGTEGDSTTQKERIPMERLPNQVSGGNNTSASPVSSSSSINPSPSVASVLASVHVPTVTQVSLRPTALKGIENRTQCADSTSQGTPQTPSFPSNVFRQPEVPVMRPQHRSRHPSTAQMTSKQNPLSSAPGNQFSVPTRQQRPGQPANPVSREQTISKAPTPIQGTNATNGMTSELEIRRIQNASQGQHRPAILSHSNTQQSNWQQNQQVNINSPVIPSVSIPQQQTPMNISSYQQHTIVAATPPAYQSQPFLGLPSHSQSQTVTVQRNHVNALQSATTVPSITSLTMARQTPINHVANPNYQNQQRSLVPSATGAGLQSRQFFQNHANAPPLYQTATQPQQVQRTQNGLGTQSCVTGNGRSGNLGFQSGYNYNQSSGATLANSNQLAHYQTMQPGAREATAVITRPSINQNSVARVTLPVAANMNPLGGGRAMATGLQVPAAMSHYQIQQQQPQTQMLAMQEIQQLQQQALSNSSMGLGMNSQNNQLAITNNNTIIFMPQSHHGQQNTPHDGALASNFGGGQLAIPSLASSQHNPAQKFRCSNCLLLFSSETSLREHEEGFCD